MSEIAQLADNLSEIIPLTSKTKVKRVQTEKQKAALKTIRENKTIAAAARKKEEEDLKSMDQEELEVRKALYQLDKEKKKAKIAQMQAWVARQQARLKAGKKVQSEPHFLSESDSSGDDEVKEVKIDPVSQVISESESDASGDSESEEEPEIEPVAVIKTARNRAVERVMRSDNVPTSARSLSPLFTREASPSSGLGRNSTVRSFVQLPGNEPVNIFSRKR
jgi:hypothetical protein